MGGDNLAGPPLRSIAKPSLGHGFPTIGIFPTTFERKGDHSMKDLYFESRLPLAVDLELVDFELSHLGLSIPMFPLESLV